MKQKQLESFGAIKHYRNLILLVEKNNNHWRKVANMLLTIRTILHPYSHIHPDNQRASAKEYAIQSLKDTKLPDHVKEELKKGINSEFKFELI